MTDAAPLAPSGSSDRQNDAQDHEETPQAHQQAGVEARHVPERTDTPGDLTDASNREAAKYRRRLRDTEAERDQLRERVERLQRTEVERYAEALVRPSAIWASGLTVADTLDENGEVDPARVDAAVDQAAQQLGLALRPRTPKPHPAQRYEAAVFPSSEDDIAAVIRGQ